MVYALVVFFPEVSYQSLQQLWLGISSSAPSRTSGKGTAEDSDPSSAAVDVAPGSFPTLVEQSTGGYDRAVAGPLPFCFQFSLAISMGGKLVVRCETWTCSKVMGS